MKGKVRVIFNLQCKVALLPGLKQIEFLKLFKDHLRVLSSSVEDWPEPEVKLIAKEVRYE